MYIRGSGYIYENLRRRGTSEVKCYIKDHSSGKCKRKSHSNTTESDLGVTTKRKTINGPTFVEDERFNPSKPFHPGPLKLDIKSIKNSTRSDSTAIAINSLENEEGRSLIAAGIIFLWIWIWKWKTTITFFIVHSLDFLWVSLKNLLGWGNEHYETTITLGDQHPPNRRRRIFNYQPDHGWPGQVHEHSPPGHHGWGPAPSREKWVHKTKNAWYHPATNLFQQPTYQYLPYGGEYTLLGYDQHQAQKYKRTYKRKFDRFRQKYYRKKKRQVIKAQRARDREKKKAERRNRKAARRKHKLELFKERVKDWQEFWNSVQGNEGGGDDDDDEAHDDNGDTGKTKGVSKKNKGANKEEIEHDDDEEEDLPLKTKEEDKKGKRKKSEEDEDDTEDDEESDDEGSWNEPSSDIEHGRPPPRKPVASSYHPDKDFDPLPSMSKNQKYIRIRLRR